MYQKFETFDSNNMPMIITLLAIFHLLKKIAHLFMFISCNKQKNPPTLLIYSILLVYLILESSVKNG